MNCLYRVSRAVVFTLFPLLAVSAASADVISTTGQPVEGEIPGVILEISTTEAGMSEVFFASDFEDLGLLIVTNGDPAAGGNDLEQFGTVFQDALTCEAEVTLNVAAGNVIETLVAARKPNVVCCIVPDCSKKQESTCLRKGGSLGNPRFTSMKDCVERCK